MEWVQIRGPVVHLSRGHPRTWRQTKSAGGEPPLLSLDPLFRTRSSALDHGRAVPVMRDRKLLRHSQVLVPWGRLSSLADSHKPVTADAAPLRPHVCVLLHAHRDQKREAVSDNFHITTPIYYVNDKPHLGHAYTTIAADVVTRWHRLNGRPAYFLTGTDEHGQKVYEAAAKRGITAQQHVDELCEPFKALCGSPRIQHDDFIRTTEERTRAWFRTYCSASSMKATSTRPTMRAGTLRPRSASGPRRTSSTVSVPILGPRSRWIKEKNYFFRMSKYADQLRDYIDDNPDFRGQRLARMRSSATSRKTWEICASAVPSLGCPGESHSRWIRTT